MVIISQRDGLRRASTRSRLQSAQTTLALLAAARHSCGSLSLDSVLSAYICSLNLGFNSSRPPRLTCNHAYCTQSRLRGTHSCNFVASLHINGVCRPIGRRPKGGLKTRMLFEPVRFHQCWHISVPILQLLCWQMPQLLGVCLDGRQRLFLRQFSTPCE